MNRFATVIAASAIALGSIGIAAPANAAPAHTWDCDTLGVKQCKGTVKGIGDAWESMEYMKKVPRYDRKHVLTYVRTVHKKPTVASQEVLVPSVNLPKTWHILTYKK